MKARLTIAVLVASNLGLGGTLVHQVLKHDEIYGDHVQQLRMDVPNQVLRVQLGRSATAGGPDVIDPERAGTLVLTPRAAIQLDVELRRMFSLIQDAAAGGQHEVTRSPDQSI